MADFRHRLAAGAAALACVSMIAMPVAAAGIPAQPGILASHGAPLAYDSRAENAYNHRWYRNRNHISTGDVFAGVVVLGAIAAIASAANDRDRERDRYRDTYRDRPVQYREPVRPNRSWNGGGIDSAVDMCVSQVERGRERVDSVDNAARDSSGWRVSGSLDNGDYFTCRIDNDGRIRSIDMGDGFAAYDVAPAAVAEGQLSDETYARARARVRAEASAPAPDSSYGEAVDADLDASGPRPAYPGGPLPGEEGYEESLSGLGG